MKACILGCEGLELSAREAGFFREADPFGFILFARNCGDPAQLSKLVTDLRDAVGREALVLIDEEGGRVQRMKAPRWRDAPAPGTFGDIHEQDPRAALELARINARLIAEDLHEVGINVNCAPSLDLREDGSHAVIGNRAFSGDPETVVALGRVWMEGLRAGGVLPVIKHLPGHGRTRVDSHLSLPVVDAGRAELETRDFAPFKACHETEVAMTGHLLFRAVDAERPATLSERVITEIIRGHIGFEGLLLTDDLSMEALEGTIGTRAASAVAAGCDIALHCNGKLEEMADVADAVPDLSGTGLARAEAAVRAAAGLKAAREPLDRQEARATLERELAAV